MRLRSLVFAALGAGFMLSATAPAFADRDDQRHHDEREHASRDHRDSDRHDWDRGYSAPPVVVAPPAYGAYYAPPPVYYGPPGVSIGISIP
jgi:Domain of unknwon function (DUF3824)